MIDENTFITLWKDRVDTELRLAARVDADTAADLLGFAPSDIRILIAAGVLKPLGSPADNATKYFSIAELAAHASNRAWLDKATKLVSQHWKKKRVRQQARNGGSATVEIPGQPTMEPTTNGR